MKIKNIKFEALKDLPTGIKKGDMFIKHDKSYINIDTGKILSFNPEKETTFFTKIVEYEMGLNIGDEICLLKQELLRSSSTKTHTFSIPAWTPLKVVGSGLKYGKVMPIIIFNNKRYELYDVKYIKAEKYFYINSSGKIHSTYNGRDIEADEFRRLSSNIYLTKDDAIMALVKIVGKKVDTKKAVQSKKTV